MNSGFSALGLNKKQVIFAWSPLPSQGNNIPAWDTGFFGFNLNEIFLWWSDFRSIGILVSISVNDLRKWWFFNEEYQRFRFQIPAGCGQKLRSTTILWRSLAGFLASIKEMLQFLSANHKQIISPTLVCPEEFNSTHSIFGYLVQIVPVLKLRWCMQLLLSSPEWWPISCDRI